MPQHIYKVTDDGTETELIRFNVPDDCPIEEIVDLFKMLNKRFNIDHRTKTCISVFRNCDGILLVKVSVRFPLVGNVQNGLIAFPSNLLYGNVIVSISVAFTLQRKDLF